MLYWGVGGLIIYFVVPLYFVLLSAPEKGGRVTIKFTSENPRLAGPALLICPRRLAELGGAGHRALAPAWPGSPEEGAGAGGRWCESLGPGAQGVREAAAPDWRREDGGGEPRETPSLRVPRLRARDLGAEATPERCARAGGCIPPSTSPFVSVGPLLSVPMWGRVDTSGVQGR